MNQQRNLCFWHLPPLPLSAYYKRPHTASVIIGAGETASFNVIYRPVEAQRSQAHLRLSVVDNQYEDSTLQLVGEGYVDDITLDNITSIPQNIPPENQEGNMAEDDVSGRWPWAAGAVLLVCGSGSAVWLVCGSGSAVWLVCESGSVLWLSVSQAVQCG